MRTIANRLPGILATIAVLATALGACGSDKEEKPEPPPPTRIAATLTASRDVNPNVAGAASPIFVRLYDLKAQTAFATAGFFALWSDEDKALGKDLQLRQELVLSPGQQVKVEREFTDEAAFLGIAAAYQDIQNATWRAIQPIPAQQTTTMQIDVGRTGLVVTVSKPAPAKVSDEPSKPKGEK